MLRIVARRRKGLIRSLGCIWGLQPSGSAEGFVPGAAPQAGIWRAFGLKAGAYLRDKGEILRDKSEMRGFFASLRMTRKRSGIANEKGAR
jgi:hypothetical protein